MKRISLAWISISEAWPLETAQRLVDHHPRMRWQCFAGGIARKQQAPMLHAWPIQVVETLGWIELHGVVDGTSGSH